MQLELIAVAIDLAHCAYMVIAGDFNCDYSEKSRLRSAIEKGCLARLGLLPAHADLPTHHQPHCAPRRIDFMFVSPNVSTLETTLQQVGSDHLLLAARLRVDADVRDPYSWKTIPWRRMSPEALRSYTAAVELIWGFLCLCAAPPPAFIGALSLVTPIVPKRRMVCIPLGGLDEDQLHQRKFLLGNERLKCKLRGLNLPGALARITSSTREALGRTSAALSPYAGICPSPGKRAATPKERRKEVTRQASETRSDRGSSWTSTGSVGTQTCVHARHSGSTSLHQSGVKSCAWD